MPRSAAEQIAARVAQMRADGVEAPPALVASTSDPALVILAMGEEFDALRSALEAPARARATAESGRVPHRFRTDNPPPPSISDPCNLCGVMRGFHAPDPEEIEAERARTSAVVAIDTLRDWLSDHLEGAAAGSPADIARAVIERLEELTAFAEDAKPWMEKVGRVATRLSELKIGRPGQDFDEIVLGLLEDQQRAGARAEEAADDPTRGEGEGDQRSRVEEAGDEAARPRAQPAPDGWREAVELADRFVPAAEAGSGARLLAPGEGDPRARLGGRQLAPPLEAQEGGEAGMRKGDPVATDFEKPVLNVPGDPRFAVLEHKFGELAVVFWPDVTLLARSKIQGGKQQVTLFLRGGGHVELPLEQLSTAVGRTVDLKDLALARACGQGAADDANAIQLVAGGTEVGEVVSG